MTACGCSIGVRAVQALEALAVEVGASDILHVAEAPYTLEADLPGAADANERVLRAAYLKQHPRSEEKRQKSVEGGDQAKALYLAPYADKELISKGEFAHDLATLIGPDFACPEYLAQAITEVIKVS
ncbi:hypothetical protein FMEAI12_5000020 [Parafrankia sp. Ea1.12]|nr:hypothetical protein FMEAI12_5000020 [Parafrankia sp. Ea1.12]